MGRVKPRRRPKAKKRRKPILLSVAVGVLTLVVTLTTVLQYQCQQQTVIVNCDRKCHNAQAILQLGEWEANREKRLEAEAGP